jgi:alpha-tubulin suppressor-like RCC1 family protein
VKCWGDNEYGQLGQGDTVKRGDGPGEMGDALPAIALGTGRVAVAISAGYFDTCAMLDDGAVKCWGYDADGELGVGDTANRGDQPGEMGDALPPVPFGTDRLPVAVSSGQFHHCAILDDGHVKCWGSNASGQLGQGDTANRGDQPGELGDALSAIALGSGRVVVTLSCGYHHSCAALDDGSLKCWGNNGSGQLGLGDIANRGDDPGEMGDALPAVQLGTGRTPFVITGGADHQCAELDDVHVKCWGDNASGQLGLGDTADRGDGPGEMGDSLPPADL